MLPCKTRIPYCQDGYYTFWHTHSGRNLTKAPTIYIKIYSSNPLEMVQEISSSFHIQTILQSICAKGLIIQLGMLTSAQHFNQNNF